MTIVHMDRGCIHQRNIQYKHGRANAIGDLGARGRRKGELSFQGDLPKRVKSHPFNRVRGRGLNADNAMSGQLSRNRQVNHSRVFFPKQFIRLQIFLVSLNLYVSMYFDSNGGRRRYGRTS